MCHAAIFIVSHLKKLGQNGSLRRQNGDLIRSTHLSLQQKIGYVFVRVEWSCLFDMFFSPAITKSTVHIFVKFFEDFAEAIKVYFLVYIFEKKHTFLWLYLVSVEQY